MRLLILCLLTLVSSSLFAQVQKGDLLLLTRDANPTLFASQFTPAAYDLSNFSFRRSPDQLSFSLNPRVGYMLTDRLLLGAGLASSVELIDDFRVAATQVELLGRYFLVKDRPVLPFGEFALTRSFFDNSLNDPGAFSTASLGLGLQFTLARNILFTPQIKFLIQDGPELGLLDLGLAFVLGKGKENSFTTDYGRGDFFFGGVLGQAYLGGEVNGFRFTPQGYYLLTNRIAVGFAPGLSLDTNDGTTNTNFNPGVGLRYFITQGNRVNLFTEVGIAAFNIFANERDAVYVYRASGGLLYFLRKNIALEAGLGVSHFRFNLLDFDTFTDLRLSTGVRFFLARGDR